MHRDEHNPKMLVTFLRCDKHPFSVSPAGTSQLLIGLVWHLPNPPRSSMDNSPTANDTPTSNDCKGLIKLWLRLCTPACHFAMPKNNSASPSPSPITSMVTNPHPSLMKCSNCSAIYRRRLSLNGVRGMVTWWNWWHVQNCMPWFAKHMGETHTRVCFRK